MMSSMVQIDVDFEVFKELTVRRTSPEVTVNDVIRYLLWPNSASSMPNQMDRIDTLSTRTGWFTKGIFFPAGTRFRANYSGISYYGIVKDGYLSLELDHITDSALKSRIGRNKFTSPSAAAIAITGNSVNGWRFWECKRPTDSHWVPISSLRHSNTSR